MKEGRCALPSASVDVQRASHSVQRNGVLFVREERGRKREHERPARKKQLTIDDDVSHVWNHHDLRGVPFARMYV